jgi:hypothetical protein
MVWISASFGGHNRANHWKLSVENAKNTMNPTDYRVGDLRDPRPRVKHSRIVTWVMKVSILLRLVFLIQAKGFINDWFTPEGQVELWLRDFLNVDWFALEGQVELWLMHSEMIATVFLFGWLARWEDQEHWITLWQILYTLEVLAVRSALFDNVWLISIAFIGLYATYFVGIYAEFTKWEKPRLPPFPMKKNDTERPKYGWLGQSFARWINFKSGRIFVTTILYFSGVAFGIFMMYAFLISEVDNLRHLPTYQNGDHSTDALWPLMVVGVVTSCISMIPPLLVEAGAIPGLVSDWWNNKRASRSYRTGVWDVCELDEDKDGPGPELTNIMQKKLLDTTIVLPCYLPNEEEILPFVLQHYITQFEKLSEHEQAEKCRKEVLVVWNSKDQHPEFPGKMDEWKAKFEAQGFGLSVHENKNSESKCDNLNLACDLIATEVCCLNDADTMLDWTCIVRGANHIANDYDIAQAMNSHCLYDCRGTPGDDNERQCHPYGILITIGDATKPQNMSTQTPFKHAPFNGRGGFWKTSSLKRVGFDHRTVGEDHDAGYRGCAYFGFKGILDMNMLCQEQEPPDCKALTSQRIRWETAALEMRRTFSWILRSKHYGRFETFVLLWGQLQQNCNLPLQSLPFQVATALPLIILKGWLSIYAFGAVGDARLTWQNLCTRDNCVWEFPVTNPFSGAHWNVALPLPMAIFVGLGLLFVLVNAFDFLVRVCTTRYKPRVMFFIYYGLLKSLFVAPYFMYVQYWALYDYCWGGAKFIATARSPLSPRKDQVGLVKPLLPK